MLTQQMHLWVALLGWHADTAVCLYNTHLLPTREPRFISGISWSNCKYSLSQPLLQLGEAMWLLLTKDREDPPPQMK